jgi:hypothetical protein
MDGIVVRTSTPWNKGKLAGQMAPFKLEEIWAIRVRFSTSASTASSGSAISSSRRTTLRNAGAIGDPHEWVETRQAVTAAPVWLSLPSEAAPGAS